MPGRRKEDSSLTDEIYEAQKLARQAQAEARAAKQDLLKEFAKLTAKVESLKDEIGAKKVADAMDNRKDRKEIHLARWHLIGVVLVALIPGFISLILNWDRTEQFVTFWHSAENAKVPLMLDLNKKPARHRKRPAKKAPPLIAPAAENEEHEHGESPGIE